MNINKIELQNMCMYIYIYSSHFINFSEKAMCSQYNYKYTMIFKLKNYC